MELHSCNAENDSERVGHPGQCLGPLVWSSSLFDAAGLLDGAAELIRYLYDRNIIVFSPWTDGGKVLADAEALA